MKRTLMMIVVLMLIGLSQVRADWPDPVPELPAGASRDVQMWYTLAVYNHTAMETRMDEMEEAQDQAYSKYNAADTQVDCIDAQHEAHDVSDIEADIAAGDEDWGEGDDYRLQGNTKHATGESKFNEAVTEWQKPSPDWAVVLQLLKDSHAGSSTAFSCYGLAKTSFENAFEDYAVAYLNAVYEHGYCDEHDNGATCDH